MRDHIDAKHVENDDRPVTELVDESTRTKRKRSNSESSIRTIPDSDLIAGMTHTIKVLNDKRDKDKEKIMLNAEVIDKLSKKITEQAESVNRLTAEKTDLLKRIEDGNNEIKMLAEKARHLEEKMTLVESEREHITAETAKIIEELTAHNKLLEE